MTRTFFLGILLSALALIFSCFCIEVTLRIYQSVTHSRTTITWHDDPFVGRRLNASQKGTFVSSTGEYKTEVEINAEGFRDTEHTKKKSVFRILLLGDSFVENFQVPLNETIFKQLERELTDSIGAPVEVIAMGLGDTGTAQQYILLKNYGLAYKPDLVLHLFFSGNDVKNNRLALMNDPYRPYFRIENNVLTQTPFHMRSQSTFYSYLGFLKSHSRFVEFLLNAKGKFLSRSSQMPVDYEVYKTESTDEYKKAWEVTEMLLTESKRITEENGGKYLIVSLANNEQVNMPVQNALKKKYPQLSTNAYDFTTPDNRLLEICARAKLACNFMYQTFSDYIKEHKVTTHYPLDGHLNQTGTDLASQFLKNAVENYLINK